MTDVGQVLDDLLRGRSVNCIKTLFQLPSLYSARKWYVNYELDKIG